MLKLVNIISLMLKIIKNFLKKLEDINCTRFIHVSSVAAFDGEHIKFNNNLSPDNSYRSTKYIQSEIIQKWCQAKNINFVQVMPSAIFDSEPRQFTNIGKITIFIFLLTCNTKN